MIKKSAEIQIISNAEKIEAELSELEVQMKELVQAQSDLEASGRKGGETYQKFGQQIEKLNSQYAKQRNELDHLHSSNRNLFQSTLDNGGAMGLLSGLTGGLAMDIKDAVEATELFNLSTKAQTAWQAISATVIGTSTGALKLFRIALVSTGIGAIVVGLGLLIANFDSVSKWVTSVTDRFGGLTNILKYVAPPIYLIIKALEALGIIESAEEAKSRKIWEDKVKRNKQEAEERTAFYDFEIAKANASGKNTVQLEKLKREAIMKTALAYNDLYRSIINSGDATQDQIKAWNENQKLITKINQDGVLAELAETKKADDKRAELAKEAENKRKDKAKENADRARDAKKQSDAEYLSLQKSINKEIQDLQDVTDQQKLDRMKSRDLQEINALKLKSDAEKQILRDLLDAKYKFKQEELDKKAKEEAEEKAKKEKEDKEKKDKEIEDNKKSLADLIESNTIYKEYADAKSAMEVEDIRIQRENKLIAQRDADIREAELLGASSEQIQVIKDFFNTKKLENDREASTQEQELAKNKFSIVNSYAKKGMEIADNLEQAGILKGKAAQKVKKALTLAQIGADTASAISSLVNGSESTGAAAGPAYLPVKIATFATGLLPILANIAKAKQLLSSSGGGGGAGGADVGSMTAQIAKPSVSFQDSPQSQITDSINNSTQERNSQPIKTYVVSGEVSTAQELERNAISESRF